MSKQIFKGFRQVTLEQFNATDEKKGYLWFVRTPQATDTDLETEGMQDANVVTDDEYDIYFGSRQYGHFRAGELDAIRNSIEALAQKEQEDVTGILNLLKGENGIVGILNGHKEILEQHSNQIAERLVKSVASGDSFLTLSNEGVLSAGMNIEYDEETHFIYVTDKDGKRIEGSGFDADVFVKDSFLKDVEFDADKNAIIFTWTMETVDAEEGDVKTETKITEVPISEFYIPYSGGTAISIAESVVDVNVADEDNFLKVNDANELQVSAVTADKTFTKEEITINGGPLADEALKVWKNGKIPADLSVQDILTKLLYQEQWASPKVATTGSYTLTANNPTIKANATGLVEVGQTVTFEQVKATNVVVASKTNPSVSGFDATYGYAETKDGEAVTGKTTISSEWTVAQKDGEVYSLSASKTNFSGELSSASVSNVSADACVLPACTLVAEKGENVYTVTETTPAYVGSHSGVASMYVVSNFNKTDDTHTSPAISAVTDVEQQMNVLTASYKVTGVYPMFTNGNEVAIKANKVDGEKLLVPHTEPVKLSLVKEGTEFCVAFAGQPNAPYTLYVQSDLKVTGAYMPNPFTNELTVDVTDKFVADAELVEFTVQGRTVNYKKYQYSGLLGADFVKFTVA